MMRKIMIGTLLCASAISAAPLMAHPGGGGAPAGVGGMGNAGGFGVGGPNGMGNAPITTPGNDMARLNSQGPANASATGIAHANSNSVLAGTGGTTTTAASLNRMFPGTSATTTITSGVFAGLTTGMTLMSNGTAVGTVQQIRTTGTGSVAVVIVRGTNGGFFAIPANKLTLSGGVLSTTSRLVGVNSRTVTAFNNPAAGRSQALMHASATGIAHANFHSVLAGRTVVSGSLAGLTTGLTVNTSGGTTLGTVSQIVTDTSGNIRLVIVTSSTGQTFRLAPTTLSLSGGVVTTTQTFG